MSDDVLPWIEKHDYATFNAMIECLPASYDDWVLAHASAKVQRPEVLEIEISPYELHRYMRISGKSRSNFDVLRDCAAEKAGLVLLVQTKRKTEGAAVRGRDTR